MSDHLSLSAAFTDLHYSSNTEDISPLKNWLLSRGNIISTLTNNPQSVGEEDGSWRSIINSEIDVRVVSAAEDVITGATSAADCLSVNPVDVASYLTSFQKVFFKHRRLLYLAECVSVGRPMNEMDNFDTERINGLLESAINELQLSKVSDHSTKSITQVFVDMGDLVSVVQVILDAIKNGPVIISCRSDSSRVLSLFVFSSLLSLAGPSEGLVAFLPLREFITVPRVSHFHFLKCALNNLVLPEGYAEGMVLSEYSGLGKSCFLVLESADIDLVARACKESVLYCCGTLSTTAHVALIQEPVFDELVCSLSKLLAEVRCENPLKVNCDVGPLPNNTMYAHVNSLLSELVKEDGATIGPISRRNSSEFAINSLHPIAISGAQTASRFLQILPDGPYVCLMPIRTVKEGVTIANRIANRRAVATVWTEVVAQAMEITSLLDFKHVGVNCSGYDLSVSAVERVRTVTISDAEDSLGPAAIDNAVSTSVKAYSSWSKKAHRQRSSVLLKAFADCEKLPEFKSIASNSSMKEHLSFVLSDRPLSLTSSTGRGSQFYRCTQMFNVNPRGVVVMLLDGRIMKLDLLFGMVVTALAFGNAVVLVINDQTLTDSLLKLQAALEGAGVDKGALICLHGGVTSTLAQTVKLRQVDFLLVYGNVKDARPLFTDDAPMSLVMNRFGDDVIPMWLEYFRKLKTVHMASGDIFAN